MNNRFIFTVKINIFIFLFFTIFIPSVFGAAKKVAFLPLEIFADESKSYLREGLSTMFISRLGGGDIEIISNDAIQSRLNDADKNGVKGMERAVELAIQIEADYVVFGSVTSLGEGYSLDLSVVDMTKKEPKETRISEAVTEDQLITRLSDVVFQLRAAIDGIDIRRQRITGEGIPGTESSKGLFFKPTEEYYSFQPSGSLPVRLDVMSFDSGDLDGDGEIELVILDRNKLLIYVKKEGRFSLKESQDTSSGHEFLKVSVGDVNEDGKDEICVVKLNGLRAESTIWEWSGKFKKIYQTIGHLQIISSSGTLKPIMLFQDSILKHFFYGKIKIMDYSDNGKLTPVEELGLPEDVQFYSLTFSDLDGDGIPEIIGLGEPTLRLDGYLNVWNRNGENLWVSDQKYGGTNNFVKVDYEAISKNEEASKIPLACRPQVADIDGDGDNEVLVVTNIADIDILTNLKVYTSSTLTSFGIQGTSLIPKLTTREIKYCIMDIQMEGETLFLAAQKPKLLKFETGSGRIMWFD